MTANTRRGPGRGIVAGNWKMHMTAGAATMAVAELLAGLAADTPGAVHVPGEVMIFPPYTALGAVRTGLVGQAWVEFGGQNVHWADHGAYTGEISPGMLVDAGCRAVLVGHSERRTLFGETDDVIARKLAAALTAGLLPVVCVGESQAERAAGETASVLARQVTKAVNGLTDNVVAGLVFAYEPVWAIGTGLAAAATDAVAAAATIRAALPASVRDAVRVLYGGSVKLDNVAEFMGRPEVDGVLVGGASLDGRGFAKLALAGLGARP